MQLGNKSERRTVMDGEGRYALFQAARPALLPTASAGFGGQFFKLPPSVRLRRTLDKKLCKRT